MSILIAVILGLVQGLCEFLPVSSSGHLLLLQKAFGIEEGSMFFSVMLHIGTLVAVCFVYRKQILDILKKPLQRKTYLLVVSTLVTVIIYLVFNKLIDDALDGGMLLGYSFLFTTLILLLSDFLPKRSGNGEITDMKYFGAVGVGLMQGIGILPGVSRSGSTIAGAKFFGLSKKDAAEYSFLLSIPAIVGGFITEVPDVIKAGFHNVPWLEIIIGMVVAAVSGYFAVKFMIKLIERRKLWGFAIYTGILGILVILDQSIFHLVF